MGERLARAVAWEENAKLTEHAAACASAVAGASRRGAGAAENEASTDDDQLRKLQEAATYLPPAMLSDGGPTAESVEAATRDAAMLCGFSLPDGPSPEKQPIARAFDIHGAFRSLNGAGAWGDNDEA